MRRLELGGGPCPLDGYEQLDVKSGREGCVGMGINVEHDTKWPVEDNTYAVVLAIHMIEHVAPLRINLMFREVLRILQPGGVFRVHVPNGPVIAQTYLEMPERRPGMQICLYGLPADFDQHKCLYDSAMLSEVFTRNGFKNVRDVTSVPEFRDRHDEGWEPLFGSRGLMSLKVEGYKA